METARAVGGKRGEGIWRGRMGNVAWAQGHYEQALGHYRGALEIARKIGDRRFEGYSLTYLGRVHRFRGAVLEAGTFQEEALSVLHEIGIKDALGECLCERGHLKLLDDQTADEELEQAHAIADEISVGPTTDLGKAVARLERAVEAHGRGEKLYYGQCLEDYPEGVQAVFQGQ